MQPLLLVNLSSYPSFIRTSPICQLLFEVEMRLFLSSLEYLAYSFLPVEKACFVHAGDRDVSIPGRRSPTQTRRLAMVSPLPLTWRSPWWVCALLCLTWAQGSSLVSNSFGRLDVSLLDWNEIASHGRILCLLPLSASASECCWDDNWIAVAEKEKPKIKGKNTSSSIMDLLTNAQKLPAVNLNYRKPLWFRVSR